MMTIGKAILNGFEMLVYVLKHRINVKVSVFGEISFTSILRNDVGEIDFLSPDAKNVSSPSHTHQTKRMR